LEYNDKIIIIIIIIIIIVVVVVLIGLKSVNWFQLAKNSPSGDHLPKQNEDVCSIKIN
jgi:flagellar basal body-associated protein FliL